jgi:glycosyltransferase involved in cell wall biosynthesis
MIVRESHEQYLERSLNSFAMSSMNKISVVIPLHNGKSTIKYVLDSLYKQNLPPKLKVELIVINDHSSDGSENVCLEHPITKHPQYEFKLINNNENLGLAGSLNEGIKVSNGDIIISLHQDCIIKDNNSIIKILNLFANNEIIAVYPTYITPLSIWKEYPFWQKVWFSRLVNKKISKLDGKFDAFRRNALMKVGLFDNNTFRTAGEDRDLEIRLKGIGKIVPSKVDVIHVHSVDPNFTLFKLLHKEAQLAECYGVLLRKWGLKTGTFADFIKIVARPIIAIGVFIPLFNKLFVPFLLLFLILYSYRAYFIRDLRVLLLPLVNILLIYIYTFYFMKGFITKKQEL